MKTTRIGKDLYFTWKIKSSCSSEPLKGKDVKVVLIDPQNNKTDIKDIFVDGDTIQWAFYGKDQQRAGIYGLTLWVNKGQIGQNVLDQKYAFELVTSTDQE